MGVQAYRGEGPVLTCVVQAAQKTNTTTIFKTHQDPIQENFRPRDKRLPLEQKLEILRAIIVEVAGAETHNQLKLNPKEDSFRNGSPSCEATVGFCIPVESTCVVAKTASSRTPKSVKVRRVLCHLVVADRSALREHECRVHVRTDFRCSACNHCCKTSEDLRRHSRSTSHVIPGIFRLSGHVLEESEPLDCSVSISSSRGEMVGMQRSVLGNLSCSQSYQIAQSAHVGSCATYLSSMC